MRGRGPIWFCRLDEWYGAGSSAPADVGLFCMGHLCRAGLWHVLPVLSTPASPGLTVHVVPMLDQPGRALHTTWVLNGHGQVLGEAQSWIGWSRHCLQHGSQATWRRHSGCWIWLAVGRNHGLVLHAPCRSTMWPKGSTKGQIMELHRPNLPCGLYIWHPGIKPFQSPVEGCRNNASRSQRL